MRNLYWIKSDHRFLIFCYPTINRKIDTLISRLSYHIIIVYTKRKIIMKNNRGAKKLEKWSIEKFRFVMCYSVFFKFIRTNHKVKKYSHKEIA